MQQVEYSWGCLPSKVGKSRRVWADRPALGYLLPYSGCHSKTCSAKWWRKRDLGVDHLFSIAAYHSWDKEQENVHGATTKVAANLFQSGTLSLGINFSKSFHSFWVPWQLVCTRYIKKPFGHHTTEWLNNKMPWIVSPPQFICWSSDPQDLRMWLSLKTGSLKRLLRWNQPWMFIGRTDAEAEAPVFWPPDAKSWLTGKDPDAGKDWRQEGRGQQRMKWLDNITKPMDMSLSKL